MTTSAAVPQSIPPEAPLSDAISHDQATLAIVTDDAPLGDDRDDALDVRNFREDLDEALVEELEAAGLLLGSEAELAQAERDAMASRCLRRAALHDVAIARHERARDLEIAMIRAHYDGLIGREQKGRAAAIQQAEILGEISAEQKGFGKKKSGETPWGTYGVTEHRAGVELVDREALLAWASVHRKDLVQVAAKVPLVDAVQYFTTAELAAMKSDVQWGELKKELEPTGELPPGVGVVPAGRVPFAKVQPAALLDEVAA